MTRDELIRRLRRLARRRGVGDVNARDVDRLLDPRLEARPEPSQRALAAPGKRVTVELEDAA